MRRELLTILFIRSSYKIRKINLLFIYYQIIKILIVLFIITFFVLLTSVIILKRTNNQLKQNIVKLENRNGFLNSEKVYKSEKNDTNNNIVKDNSIQFDFRNILSDKIDVQDLKITIPEKEAKIDISFKVINLEESDEPAKGYVIVGGFPEKGKISDHIFFPQSVQLNSDRVITNFEKGEPFSIRKFKNEKIAFLKPTSFDIKNIVIFVFSEQGDIISRKVEKIHAW